MPDATPPFYEEAYRRARPDIVRIRSALPTFPSPPLRVQRVSQLDADLLDQELTDLLAEPVKASLRMAFPSLDTQLAPELYLLLRLVVYKFSIYDHGATYGAMLQNLKYRDEWSRQRGLQSTARDAPLRTVQLALYPLLSIVFPYVYKRAKSNMLDQGYAEAPADSEEFLIWSVLEQAQRAWNVLSLANFALFLWNGKYRTIVDRILGMRLTYASRALNRNVSFEFLNRQLVWNAFTEFLLFLLPLIKPRRILRRATRLVTHPKLLASAYATLPRSIAQRAGLEYDAESDQVLLKSARRQRVRRGKYWQLPLACCPLCFERLEKAAGVDVDTAPPAEAEPRVERVRASIPSTNPLHPRKGLLARRQQRNAAGRDDEPASDEQQTRRRRRTRGGPSSTVERAESRQEKPADSPAAPQPEPVNRPSLEAASPNGIKYLDALASVPYRTLPCAEKGHGCVYCYYCITDKLLDESMEDELQRGGWPCLRCGELVTSASRVEAEASDAEHVEDVLV